MVIHCYFKNNTDKNIDISINKQRLLINAHFSKM